ncbi:MAG: DUF456 family protein [Phycisphaerae bacterium]|nr:DUF456 family protein [Phycisphaerae bacterium]
MTALAGTILTLCCLVGVALAVLGLPGTWLMVLAALGIEAWKPELLSWGAIIAAASMAAVAEIADFAAGAVGAKKAGGGKRSAVGAIIGGVVGGIIGTVALPIPVIGTVLGAAIGSGLAAAAMELSIEGRTTNHIRRVGWGAFIGRLVATVLKTAFAVMIASVLVASLCFAGW